jgi:hypothetical protein
LPDVDSNLVSIGDANLRQDLTGDPADGLGAALVNGTVIRVTSIAAMEAYSAPVGYVFSLNAGGRSGTFDVIAGDFSAELAADTENGVYIGLSDDTTATTKVCRRRIDGFVKADWFGADRLGVIDSTTAIEAANEFCNGSTSGYKTILFAGEYLFSSTITLNRGVVFLGDGNTAAFGGGGEGSPARLIKAASMTSVGIRVDKRAGLHNIGVFDESGASGGGVQVIGNYVSLKGLTSNGHGGGGFGLKVGAISSDPSDFNTNGYYLEDITTARNTGDGVSIGSDLITSTIVGGFPSWTPNAPDCNAGILTKLDARENDGTGLKVINCFFNVFSMIHCEVNSGYGLYTEGTRDLTFIGGDFEESNTLGNIEDLGVGNNFFGATAIDANFGSRSNVFTRSTAEIYNLKAKESLRGVTSSKAGAPLVTTTENQALKSAGSGVGFGFYAPDGGNSIPAKLSGSITVEQRAASGTDANTYYMHFNTRRNDVMERAFSIVTKTTSTPSVNAADDNLWELGNAGLRWKEVFSATGTINTSDGREKTDVKPLSEAERSVARKLKGLIKTFKMKSAVEEKGEDARIHAGVIAQEVVDAFSSEGLDAYDYAMLCYNEWEEDVDADGNITMEAGNRYGIRYDQLLAFVISTL